jgi:predicted HAD superfamily Cof-like phosphohydrolase
MMEQKMSNMYFDVATFITACDQERTEANAELYKDLIIEEWAEFWDAVDATDDVEELDACMDMIWVILGYCHMRGWDVNGAWHEVARSNLDKIDNKTGKVIKNEAGKVMKPDGWRGPALAKFARK